MRTAPQGSEEDIVEGIQDIVGSEIPIIGGSAADNPVSGDWLVFDGISPGLQRSSPPE